MPRAKCGKSTERTVDFYLTEYTRLRAWGRGPAARPASARDSRAKDAGQVRAMHHLACEVPGDAREQRAGGGRRGGQAQVEGGAGAPLGGVADPPGGGRCRASRTRSGRGRAASRRRRSPSPARTGRSPSLRARGAAGSSGSWRSMRPGRASSLRTGWRRHRIQTRFRILATTHSLGRDEPGTRPRAYTNFLDATRPSWSRRAPTFRHSRRQFP
jgi:hypothetical protein